MILTTAKVHLYGIMVVLSRGVMKNLTLLLVILGALYGASYQQFRHFNIDMPKGSSDAHSYVAMSHGDYEVTPIHRYRVIIPFLAGALQRPLGALISDPYEVDKLSFYMVNFMVIGLTAVLLYLFHIRLGFRDEIALLGVLLFVCSRIVIITTATPLVDSLYYLAIVGLLYLVQTRNLYLLCAMLPLMVLVKETFLPIILLPFMVADFRKVPYLTSVIVSVLVFIGWRMALGEGSDVDSSASLYGIVERHVQQILFHLKRSFTLSGLHDWQNGFSFMLILSMLGIYRDLNNDVRVVPSYLLWLIPLGIGYGLLSGNMGRMLFTAFVPLYTYALIVIDAMLSQLPKPLPNKEPPHE